ncbi:MAG: outer membrane lipoprotein carrier protein LolA [Deltaproteobacteria bacterium]|jgi:outer membrane lipoprotein carrier protein|nr:outer membrane lipoprotein carrier protein LolA [Deltaproteobacteria bacterium]
MRFRHLVLILFAMTLSFSAHAEEAALPAKSIDEILERVEQIYTASSFSTSFIQASTIKAMEITDSASGKLYVQYPGKMRWEYLKPESQLIVTDGVQLWMYRPEDNQVMLGQASTFFSEGKGAGFLSDIRLLRKDFSITLEAIRFGDYYNLKLVPLEKNWDIAYVHLLISKTTFHIAQVFTYNAYDDVTRIELVEPQFDIAFDDAFFTFKIPQGVDILRLDDAP